MTKVLFTEKWPNFDESFGHTMTYAPLTENLTWFSDSTPLNIPKNSSYLILPKKWLMHFCIMHCTYALQHKLQLKLWLVEIPDSGSGILDSGFFILLPGLLPGFCNSCSRNTSNKIYKHAFKVVIVALCKLLIMDNIGQSPVWWATHFIDFIYALKLPHAHISFTKKA